ncbi:MAG TPA: cupin domain-containing protein, partial [Nannocystis exedens]|nr:cupin domain-containing protein [Nannocystis exedens]
HFQGGASVATADVGFVRIDPGARFPLHHHGGDERGLVLQGLLREDGSGALAGPGDEVYRGPNTSHSVTSAGDQPLIYAVVVYDIDVPGLELSHAD